MSKQIDTIKLIKYKNSRLRGKSICKSLIDAGYKETTANHHQSELSVVKCVEEEIRESMKDKITIDYVLKGLEKEAISARNPADRIRAYELLGKYLAMFTDKYKQEGDLPPPNYIINTINTNKDIKRDIPQVVLDDVDNK